MGNRSDLFPMIYGIGITQANMDGIPLDFPSNLEALEWCKQSTEIEKMDKKDKELLAELAIETLEQ